jgi:hypothetical protein
MFLSNAVTLFSIFQNNIKWNLQVRNIAKFFLRVSEKAVFENLIVVIPETGLLKVAHTKCANFLVTLLGAFAE